MSNRDYTYHTQFRRKQDETYKVRRERAIAAFNGTSVNLDMFRATGVIPEGLEYPSKEEKKKRMQYDQLELLNLVIEKYDCTKYDHDGRIVHPAAHTKPPFTIKYTWYHNLRYLIFKFKMLFLG